MKKVLWLASWYPNKLQPFNGDFVQRHARAVARYNPVHVIFVVKDAEGKVTSTRKLERTSEGMLSEDITYYKPWIGLRGLFGRIYSIITYFRINLQLIRAFVKENGKPELVHVHVALWAGVLARWLKIWYGIPYVVTEHWSGYHKESLHNVYNKGAIFRTLTVHVLTGSKMLLPVSVQLGKAMNKLARVPFKAIPNCVDTSLFNLQEERSPVFRFIHVSTMNHPKNVEGILTCFSRLLSVNRNWHCMMVGPDTASLREYSSLMKLVSHLTWKGEISYSQVAHEMKQADVLVMFSRYENLPCVILEAQCCGLPVIASRVGGIPEIVDVSNGMLVKAFDEDGLLSAMTHVIHRYSDYNREKISNSAKRKYSFQAVGEQVLTIYMEVLNKP